MGKINTEQAVQIIDSVSNALKQPEVVTEVVTVTPPPPEPTNYWWLLLIAAVPVIPQIIKALKKKG